MTIRQHADPIKHCRTCGKIMARVRFGKRLEDLGRFRLRVYCDRSCMAAGMMGEDPSDAALLDRQQALRKDACEHCGRDGSHLQLHHVDFDRSNDLPENLLTLCASCHAGEHWRLGKNGCEARP